MFCAMTSVDRNQARVRRRRLRRLHVLLDGAPVVSCLLPAKAVAGKAITTVEGIAAPKLHPVQHAFMALDALAMRLLYTGFIVEARPSATLGATRVARRRRRAEEIAAALSGHLCRCGAYDNILRAVAEACSGRFDGDDAVAPRIEARAKVTGGAQYTVDIRHDGQLEGVVLRANAAHARVARARSRAGAGAPRRDGGVSLLHPDRTVHYLGEPIAALAARDAKTRASPPPPSRSSTSRCPRSSGSMRRADRKPRSPLRNRARGRQRVGGRGNAGAVEGQCARALGTLLHGKGKARRLSAARAERDPLLVEAIFRTAESAAYLPRAPCRRRPLR